MMRYLPLTDGDRREMLGAIGVDDIDDLFVDVPESARRDGLEIFNVISRQNDLFDALFECAAPRPAGLPSGALGRAGLGARRPDWVDLQLDGPGFERWLATRGARLGPAGARICHRSFYARPNAMAFYARILRDRARWSIGAMRADGLPEALCPRWSRLAPRRDPTRWAPRAQTGAIDGALKT